MIKTEQLIQGNQLYVVLETSLRRYNSNYSIQRASDHSLLLTTPFGSYHIQIGCLDNTKREDWPE